jgi:hypothetical protein
MLATNRSGIVSLAYGPRTEAVTANGYTTQEKGNRNRHGSALFRLAKQSVNEQKRLKPIFERKFRQQRTPGDVAMR